ncbi:Homeobox domain [Dillenia turbinata]|uniref:Homeobox domain n=1 Tax=Dillenia turbinata TaxID=194707 RepID=A0AAN8YZ87_9MAGN
MASSNRHWPSMFKSKPCNTHHHHHQRPHHDIDSSLINTGCHRAPYSSGCEERSPEPKPRWNPKPEQIRILEAIFNSGMVNPPRDEIRKIRAQLQEYGQVGDANVFYWFQNRKSRSKHKQRHLQQASKSSSSSSSTSQQVPSPPPQQQTPPFTTKSLSSSSSSSSEKSSPNSQTFPITSPVNLIDISPSINQGFNFHAHNDQFLSEQFLFPMVQPSGGVFTQGLHSNFSDMSTSVVGHVHVHVPEHHHHHPHQNLFLTELMNQCASSQSMGEHEEKLVKLQMQQLAGYTMITTTTTTPGNTNTVVAPPPPPPSISDTTIAGTLPSSSISQVQATFDIWGRLENLAFIVIFMVSTT